VRRFVLILAVALLAGGALHQLLDSRQGFVLLSVGHYVIETSLWTALVLVLLVIALLWLARRLWRMLVLPGRWVSGRGERRRRRHLGRTLLGFVDFIEGNWPAAVDKLRQARGQGELPGVNFLAAAAASHNMGDREGAERMLAEAEAAGAADSFTLDLLRARFVLQEGDAARALPLAEALHRSKPHHPGALRLLASARKAGRDWRGIEALLPDLRRHAALSRHELAALETEVYREMLDAFGANQSPHLGVAEGMAALDRLWQETPRHLHQEPSLVAAYVRQMARLGRADKAETRLARFLAKHWDSALAELYGGLEGDVQRQLVVAEAWLRERPEDPRLLRALGQLSARAELWGKARAYLERSLALAPDPRTHAALGDLLGHLGDTPGSLACYRRGLASALGRALPGADQTR